VEEVSWFDADSFCQKIGGRLATEAEWEYAARAGTDTIYICGDDRSCLDSIAWYWNNSGETTHPVCQKTPNAWGLCDMTGNVWQWVNDWYNESYYPISPVNDPPGPATGSERVLRGGSWQYSPRFARPSVRFKFNPDYRLNYLGFRCTRD
jgi:formylglycine-generating enzyme required for sulfatase activity